MYVDPTGLMLETVADILTVAGAVITTAIATAVLTGYLVEILGKLLSTPSPEEEPDNIKNVREFFEWDWTGEHVTDEFLAKVVAIAELLCISPDDLMAVMAWESWLNPSQKNLAGGSAVGLIQFTAASITEIMRLNPEVQITRESLLEMSAIEQLDYVYLHFKPYAGKMNNLADVYMAVLWPRGIGESNDYVLWEKDGIYPGYYKGNSGVDINKDGIITKEEAVQKVIDRRNTYKKKR